MADEKKGCPICGFFGKLFRSKKSSCCDMKIEEAAEAEPLQTAKPQAKPSCCGGKPSEQKDK